MGLKRVIEEYSRNRKCFSKEIALNTLYSSIIFSLDSKTNWNFPFNNLKKKIFVKRNEIIEEYLINKYSFILDKYKNTSNLNYELVESKLIWVCWFQGFEQAPNNVKKCLSTIKKHSNGFKVIELDQTNFLDYVDIPQDIIKKWRNKEISNQLFSDVLRIYLLYQNGGLWLDATCMLIKDIPVEIIFNDIYFSKNIDDFEGSYKYVDILLWEAYFLYSKKNNPYLKYMIEMIVEYIRNENCLIDYLLINYIAKVGREKNYCFKKMFDDVPSNNSKIEIARRNLNHEYKSRYISQDTFLIKTNSYEKYNCEIKGNLTLYGYLNNEEKSND